MENKKIAVIGLGYVGLPLAVEFGKQYQTIGFDIHQQRVDELNDGLDRTNEVEAEELALANQLVCTTDKALLKGCDFYIVTVPTPIDKHRQPDLTPLRKASEMLGSVIGKGATGGLRINCLPGGHGRRLYSDH